MSNILACLSGGVESTYGVYRLLTETIHDVTLFHLYFRNHPRYDGETEACEHIVNWLEENTRKFDWKSADLSYSGVNEITQPLMSADICYTTITSANISVDEIAETFLITNEEYNKSTFDIPFIFDLFNLILSRFPEINTKLVLDREVGKLDKTEIYEKLPEELRNHIHSNDKEYNV